MISNIDPDKCTGCGICVEVCPLDTLRLDPFQEAHPPCRQTCPAGVDVRGFLFYFNQGMLQKASAYLQDFLPFPAITGLLCHHPCEKVCARQRVDQAINIHGIEYYIGTSLIPETIRPRSLLHASKAAVVGSGPAGLSVAYFLRRMGYAVTVFESHDKFGGSFLKEASEKRLPMEVLDAQIRAFKKMDISFIDRCKLSKDMSINELKDQRYEAICLATGFGASFAEQMTFDNTEAVSVDPITLKTNIEGVFAGGGLVAGHLSLIKIIASAKRAAISMDRFLRKEGLHAESDSAIKKVRRLPRDGIKQKPRLDPDGGFHEGTALKEAHRCMSCGSLAYIAHPEDCMTCFECELKCPSKAVKVHPFKEVLPMTLAIK
ncbi:MAG: NAD(P)-binding protein [Proteobacteria bacterium]|nr:NAD(P)-binding protein [Pseudomonadota bacterium]